MVKYTGRILEVDFCRGIGAAAGVFLCLACGHVAAREADIQETGLPAGVWLESRTAVEQRPFGNPLLGDGLLAPAYFEAKDRLWIEKGLSVGGYLSANSQWGSRGGPSHQIGEFLLTAEWELLRTASTSGRIVFGLAHDQTSGPPTTRVFADKQGLVETPNDLDTDPDLTFTTLGLLLWEQEFRLGQGGVLGYRVGQIFAPAYFGLTHYLDDDRRYFLARPLAAPGGAQWVGANDIGLGGNVFYRRGEWYISAAVIDGKANRQYPDFGSLADGQFLYTGEFGYERDPGGDRELAVRVTASHLDVADGEAPQKGPGGSVMLSAMMRLGPAWGIAGRWSRSFRRLSSDYRQLVSVGLVRHEPMGRQNDFMAVGAFVGDPSDPSRATESGVELAYRIQLTQAVNLMPDLQFWTGRDASGKRSRAWIAGVRLNFEY